MDKVTTQLVFGQIRHWITTPQNAYLGSNYGIDLYQYLQLPMTSNIANEIIAKMRNDIPILQAISEDNLNIYATDTGSDTKRIFIEVNGLTMEYDLSKIPSNGTG